MRRTPGGRRRRAQLKLMPRSSLPLQRRCWKKVTLSRTCPASSSRITAGPDHILENRRRDRGTTTVQSRVRKVPQHDTFRSNQIRERQMSRDKTLAIVREETCLLNLSIKCTSCDRVGFQKNEE